MTERERTDRATRTSAGDEPPPAPTLWQSWMSVLAAFFGVQSSANRERDFTSGKASHFILLGLLATAVLIGLLAGIVALIMRMAT